MDEQKYIRVDELIDALRAEKSNIGEDAMYYVWDLIEDFPAKSPAEIMQEAWIPVTDEIPSFDADPQEENNDPFDEYIFDESRPILALVKGHIVIASYHKTTSYPNHDEDYWSSLYPSYSYSGNYHGFFKDITHWMPLPELPKGDKL